MEEELFGDLVQSLKEAKDIRLGKTAPSRLFHVNAIDVKAIREKTGMTQEAFAPEGSKEGPTTIDRNS